MFPVRRAGTTVTSLDRSVRQGAYDVLGPIDEAVPSASLAQGRQVEERLAPLADERALQQIFVNLLQNAIKFTGEGGAIAVRLRRAGSAVNIYVGDTGIGIPKDAIGKLGHPFEQVESEFNKSYKGSGLGLAIAKSLAELHGGNLRIRSQEGIGTIVMVHLPLTPAIEAPTRFAAETVH